VCYNSLKERLKPFLHFIISMRSRERKKGDVFMKTWKRVASMLMALTLTGSFAACDMGGNNNDNGNSNTGSTDTGIAPIRVARMVVALAAVALVAATSAAVSAILLTT